MLAICPQPAINPLALLITLSGAGAGRLTPGFGPRPGLDQATAQKLLDGGSFDGFFNEFANMLKDGNMTSQEVLVFYKFLTLDSAEVIERAVAVLENGTEVNMEEAFSVMPNNEAGDCPTMRVPGGLMGVAEIR